LNENSDVFFVLKNIKNITKIKYFEKMSRNYNLLKVIIANFLP